MGISGKPTVVFVLLGLCTFYPTELIGSKLCEDPSTIKLVKTVDVTKAEGDFYYCYTSLAKRILSNCYNHLTPTGDKNSKGTRYFYDISTDKVVNITIFVKMEDNPGVYYISAPDSRRAMTYITDVTSDKKCMTYFKCFTGGSWGGAESSGEYAAILCGDPKQCEGAQIQKLKDNIEANLLSGDAKLQKLDQEKCASLGIIPNGKNAISS